jgi:hypothetical protein
MHINHLPGLVAVLLAVVCFYGSTYAVIALNIGWRFGYWVAGATFGALMLMMSIFWLETGLGPRGEEGHWVPLAAGRDISQVSFEGKSLTTPAQYPTGPWTTPDANDPQAGDFSSSLTSCVTTPPASLADEEKKVCEDAQTLMPPTDKIPVLGGSAVAVTPKMTDIRFASENGQLAQALVRPVTTDPRISKSPGGKLLAPEFRVLAILDKGSLRKPPLFSVLIFGAFFAFHLAGLSRAERRKLNPAVI